MPRQLWPQRPAGKHPTSPCPPHHRIGAAGYPWVEFEGDDPLAFVIAKNLKRRHLTESQRAMVAAKLAKLPHGGDRRSDQAANLPLGPTQGQAATMLNVSERTVRHARTR